MTFIHKKKSHSVKCKTFKNHWIKHHNTIHKRENSWTIYIKS